MFVLKFCEYPFSSSVLYFNKNYFALLLFLIAETSGRFDCMIDRLFTGGKKCLGFFLFFLYYLLGLLFPFVCTLMEGFGNGLLFKNSFDQKNINNFSNYSYILLLFPY